MWHLTIRRMENDVNRKVIIKISILLMFVLFVAVAFDARLKIVHYSVEAPEITSEIRIALITDVHSCYYGKDCEALIEAICEQEPDVVLFGGDIFDDDQDDWNAEALVQAIGNRYKSYYVTGNHEYWSGQVAEILPIFLENQVTVLEGAYETITVNGQEINICGIDDPEAAIYTDAESFYQQLTNVADVEKNGNYTVLLSHRPEYEKQYFRYGFDLVLCGHAHGGQWRIPFLVNGMYSPNQGIFPKYAGGRYDFKEGTMIVSRGLARESTPLPRIFNRPELVIVTIE